MRDKDRFWEHSLFGQLLLLALPSAPPKSCSVGLFIKPLLPTSQGFLTVFLHQDFVLGY